MVQHQDLNQVRASLPADATGLDFAKAMGQAKLALALQAGDQILDLSQPLPAGEVALITRDDEGALELIRHDAAHVMAEAVQTLYPGTQVTIGPPIADGFYYDFARPEPFTPEDLPKIEKLMRKIVARRQPFTREVWSRQQAIDFFTEKGEAFKVELIKDLPEDEVISIYRQGEWLDLCRGPHAPHTGHVGEGFKLLRVAGAYWRGDHRNAMLTRIYGTAWRTKQELGEHLERLEQARKRDHRRLLKAMDLGHFEPECPGAVFWHHRGWMIHRQMVSFIRARRERAGYQEVNTPEILDRGLWERSGHWEAFAEHMFTVNSEDPREYAVKPMNCPGGVTIYNAGITSYRDLPLRMAEFGKVHRYEPSGALHGLMRVRAFTQDDSHIFCTVEQMTQECIGIIDLVYDIYKAFGFEDISIKYADRPEVRIGSDETWDQLEQSLLAALKKSGRTYTTAPGEGAFYGPKLEFHLRDAIGRSWQCGTVQVDTNLPDRLGASYVQESGDRAPPVMLHVAILGSIERFMGIVLEHYAGWLPLWLAPTHAVIATVTDASADYAREVTDLMRTKGLRAEADLRNEKIGYKIREHSARRVPIVVTVGKREAQERTLSLRHHDGRREDGLPLDQAVQAIQAGAAVPA
ncbi:MAG: threonine--tRNA ligase [Pseudomonadota bacterium]